MQQYIGAVMLISALFLVLLSNHMEERLRDGKPVPRVDCCMTRPVANDDGDKVPGEETLLLPQEEVCTRYLGDVFTSVLL